MATIKAINPVTKQAFDVNEAEFNSGVYKGWTRADATPTTPPPTNLQKLSVGMANGSITNQSQVPIDTTIKTSDLKPENIINNASIVNKAKVEATTLTPDQIFGLNAASTRIAQGRPEGRDIELVNEAKKNKGYVYTAPTVNNQNLAQNGSNISGNTQGQQTQPEPVYKSALDQKMEIVNNYRANKAAETAEAKEEYGVADIQKRQIEIQTKANEILAKIEKSQTDQNAEDILNEEAKIALKNKIEGQTISMSHINRQLLRGLEDLNQAQRLDRLYDTYELNTQINQYNALNRNAQLLQGQYTQAMDNVKESVDDWQTEQDLKMQILEEQGNLEKEEKSKIEAEIKWEKENLLMPGYVYIESTDTYNKLVKQFGVNAGNFSSFFYKDPTNGKIYLKPQTGGDKTVDAYVNQINSGKIKLTSVPASVRDKVAVALNGGGSTNNNSNNKKTSQTKNVWTKEAAETDYKTRIASGESPASAAARVKELSGYIPKQAQWDMAKQFVADNAGADSQEIKAALLENTDLSVTEITSLLPKSKSSSTKTP